MKLKPFAGCLLLTALTLGTTSTARAAEPVNYPKFVADRADALVVLKFVLKAGEQEIDAECSAVMIEPTGLAICSSVGIGGTRGTPTALKVLVGQDDNGVEAKLLARDSELDLAWVQVKSPPTKPYVFVDLSKAAVPAVGDSLVSLRRMIKYFDRAPVLNVGLCVGITRKPRDLFVPGGMAVDPGGPIFMTDGRVAGFVVLQVPDAEDRRGSPAQAFGRERDYGNVILPTADVVKATERAKKAKEGEEMSAKAVEQAKKEAEAAAKEATGAASPTGSAPAPKPGPTTRPVDDEEEGE